MMANRDITSEISHCHQSMNILVVSDCPSFSGNPFSFTTKITFLKNRSFETP